MMPVTTIGRVLATLGDLAVLQVGRGILCVPRGDLGEGDLLELRIVDGTGYSAVADDRCAQATWVLLHGPLGSAAITLPQGTCLSPRVDILFRPVPLETSEGFDLDPDTSDPSVAAAGAEPVDLESVLTFSAA